MLINVKMPTIVDILTFMSMINSVLGRVEHEKFYNLRARLDCSLKRVQTIYLHDKSGLYRILI